MKFQTKPTSLDTNPLVVFEQLLSQHEQCFLLETLADTYQPQTTSQSYIGVAPDHCYSARDGSFFIDGQKQNSERNPYQQLGEQISFDTSLPPGYIGGLVGYFAHEGIANLEPCLEFSYRRDFPDFEFGNYSDGLLFRPDQAPDYFFYGQDRSAVYNHPTGQRQTLNIKFISAAKDAVAYEQMFNQARDDITNGRVFQVVLANKYDYKFTGDLIDLYRELRRINPSPFMFFIKFGNIVTLGASPELLAHTKPSGAVFLEALAGTIRRGDTPQQDAELAATLLADTKEVAEHSMLVDLARNDVGRVSQIGSVKIDDLMYIKKLSHVQHISSIISGQLAEGRDAFDSLAASFPAGTMSGAPKLEAITMIRELEGYERGPYAGTIGYFSYNGDSMHAVNLRSVSAVGDKLVLHSGSGVVYDSTAAHEFQEISDKKAAMDNAMAPFLKESLS